MHKASYDIYIDTGGTFTDCLGRDHEGRWYRRKVLSHGALRGLIKKWLSSNTLLIEHNWGLEKDIIRGYQFRLLKHIHEVIYVQSFDLHTNILRLTRDLPASLQDISMSFEIATDEEAPVLGARLITQTPLDLDLPAMNIKLGSTKGTNALLEKNGADVALFVTRGFRDILEIGTQQRPDIFSLNVLKREMLYSDVVEVHERIDASGKIIEELDPEKITNKIRKLKRKGVDTAAICLLNSYNNPVHEYELAAFLRKNGFSDISISASLSAMIKYLPRMETAVVNAYLSPVLKDYLANVRESNPGGLIHMMTSAGSLVKSEYFQAKDSLLSGPAGGVVGASVLAKKSGFTRIISFDMGGTSTDVSRFDNEYDYCYDLKIGNAHIFSQALAIESVAAGGGSVCYYDGYKLCVGPQSAGADPGPASYGANGPLTITDVNILLGRLDSRQFNIPVFTEEASEKLEEVCAGIADDRGKRPRKEEILTGFLQIANEIMAGAIKKISISRGYDPAEYSLVAFGGAGGMHACSIADILGMESILVPEDAGLLSSYGLAGASIERFAEQQLLQDLDSVTESLPGLFDELAGKAVELVKKEGVTDNILIRSKIISLRFKGQDSSIHLPYDTDIDLMESFWFNYEKIYGYYTENKNIEVESIRVLAGEADREDQPPAGEMNLYKPEPSRWIDSWVAGNWEPVPVFLRKDLDPGASIEGFALLLDKYSTTVIEQNWSLSLDANRTAVLSKVSGKAAVEEKTINLEARLELFTRRFMFIAENMGAMLQRTSLSVNIKERLDFSCALIDPEGRLVANAPHIPVHLGGLGVCVRKLKESFPMEPGDTIITNHPLYGGSHLPDITLVTPVFTKGRELLGYVVNRAHHSEIGGSTPASMPPDATSLVEEGVVIPPVCLLKRGLENWSEIRRILETAPYPTRSLDENLADLNAALAANMNGAEALRDMARNFGTDTVLTYFRLLREHASRKMEETLKDFPDGEYIASEFLDDGTPLQVKVISKGDRISIDFAGSGGTHPGNMNATVAIVNSVVIYVMRLLLNEDIPLNEGMLEPLDLLIPAGMLNPDFSDDPSACPAIVGGNVEVSQRLTDTLLKAFGVVACSQGTMNNLLIGNDSFSYYETICGGCGAGPDFRGASAVHHHMTNTRITDPEILELRYPLRLNKFSIRKGSGGKGLYKGGNGVVREFTFLEPATISILSQHRKEEPFGLKGGDPGKRGRQWIRKEDQSRKMLEGVDGAEVEPGDSLIIKTPGGGGWGKSKKA